MVVLSFTNWAPRLSACSRVSGRAAYAFTTAPSRRAGVGVGRIRDGRAAAGVMLDQDLEPGRGQPAERFGNQGDTPFSGRRLPGDADLHGHHLMSCLQSDNGLRMGRTKDTDRRAL